MSDFKKFETIENTDNLGVVSLAIRPNQASKFGEGNLSGKDLQRRFDRLANAIVKEYNNLVKVFGNAYAEDANGNPLDRALSYIAWRVKTNSLTGEKHTESLSDFMDYLKNGTFANEILYVSNPTVVSDDGEESELDNLNSVLKTLYAKITASFGRVQESLSALEEFTGFDENVDSIPETYYTNNAQKQWAKDLSSTISNLSDLLEILSDFVGYAEDKTLEDKLAEIFAKKTNVDKHIEELTSEIGEIASSVEKTASDTANDLNTHKTDTDAHNDIRLQLQEFIAQVKALHDVDDETLDQTSEVIALIKSNKGLIDTITTNKVNVTDIINNLTTNNSKKPLSAAMGVELKRLFDSIANSGSGGSTVTIVDNLDSTATDKALSAKQGYELNKKFDNYSLIYPSSAQWKHDYGMLFILTNQKKNGAYQHELAYVTSSAPLKNGIPRRDANGKLVAHDHDKNTSPSYYVSEKELAKKLIELSESINNSSDIQVGDGLENDFGKISVKYNDTLEIRGGNLSCKLADYDQLGVVKVGSGLSVDNQGVLSVKPATTTQAGIVVVGDGLSATYDNLGNCKISVKVGDGLSFDDKDALSVKVATPDTDGLMPAADKAFLDNVVEYGASRAYVYIEGSYTPVGPVGPQPDAVDVRIYTTLINNRRFNTINSRYLLSAFLFNDVGNGKIIQASGYMGNKIVYGLSATSTTDSIVHYYDLDYKMVGSMPLSTISCYVRSCNNDLI